MTFDDFMSFVSMMVVNAEGYVDNEDPYYVLTNKAGENIDRGVEPHIALEVKEATGQDEYGDNVKYSDFSAFYAPSVGEQIVNWYAHKQ